MSKYQELVKLLDDEAKHRGTASCGLFGPSSTLEYEAARAIESLEAEVEGATINVEQLSKSLVEYSEYIARRVAEEGEANISAIRKLRRTQVVGLEATPKERRAWDKGRYDAFKAAEDAIRARSNGELRGDAGANRITQGDDTRTLVSSPPDHASDCAMHSAPALEPAPCDCGRSNGPTPPVQETAPAGVCGSLSDRLGAIYQMAGRLMPDDNSDEWAELLDEIVAVLKIAEQSPDLASPNSVHISMLRGSIAIPSLRQYLHAVGGGALGALEQVVEIAGRNEASPAIEKIKGLLSATTPQVQEITPVVDDVDAETVGVDVPLDVISRLANTLQYATNDVSLHLLSMRQIEDAERILSELQRERGASPSHDAYSSTLLEYRGGDAASYIEALTLLAADVEAYHRSCTCSPPVTDRERENLARAKRLIEGAASSPASSEFKPDWTLTDVERVIVALSLALPKHVPGWPGCTDEQMEAVARAVVEDVTKPSPEVTVEELHDDALVRRVGDYLMRQGLNAPEQATYAAARGAIEMIRVDAASSPAVTVDGFAMREACAKLVESLPAGFGDLNRNDVAARIRSIPIGPVAPSVEPPAGWKLMPSDGDGVRDMAEAARHWAQRSRKPSQGIGHLSFWLDAYRAMYAAAPTPTVSSASAREDLVHADRT